LKLASLKGGRDGQLVVVSRDLSRYLPASDIAPTLQAALDDWQNLTPALEGLFAQLDEPGCGEPFDETQCAAPLPRAYQWADGSSYVNHVELVRGSRGAAIPTKFWVEPLIYQGGSDSFIGARDPILAASEDWGIDFEAEIVVITGDVPMGADSAEASSCIRLITLTNDVSLRNLIPDELEKGFGFFQGKPSSAFSPVAVTPDELGPAWLDAKVHLPMLSYVNNEPFGKPEAGVNMNFNFGDIIAHTTKTRSLTAGTLVGSGTVSNKLDGGPGKRIVDGGLGYSCIAEQRAIEIIRLGAPHTPYLGFGDCVRIEMRDTDGLSVFGAIENRVEKYSR